MLKISGIGGGTGLPMLLRGLKQLSGKDCRSTEGGLDLSAIVCVSDNGGSSGRLCQSFGIPAVGDLRNCLVALSDSDRVLPDIFQYRFNGGDGLEGHALGNLIVAALLDISGSLREAVEMARGMLFSKGHVLPVSERVLTLCAQMDSGNVVRGECQITAARSKIKKVWLEPDDSSPSEDVLETLDDSDAIIMGPGSLYTSIIPNLLVSGVAEAMRRSAARKIFVCNLMTEPGETDDFSASDHLRAIETYLGKGVVDIIVVNSQLMEQCSKQAYAESGAEPVWWNKNEIERMGAVPVVAELLSSNQSKIRHDSGKLARLILSLTRRTEHARDNLSWPEGVCA